MKPLLTILLAVLAFCKVYFNDGTKPLKSNAVYLR